MTKKLAGLKLSRETVRRLNPAETGTAAGYYTTADYTCGCRSYPAACQLPSVDICTE